MKEKIISIDIGGKPLILKTGLLAKQANASVTVQYGETVVLVTLVTKTSEEVTDFVPLMVDYRERTYAAGRIPGGFFKREGRPRESEILASRLIDRPLRPLFPKGINKDIILNAIVLSSDQENNPDLPALIGSSMAVILSGLPFSGPIGGVRVGYVKGEFKINPTFSELEDSDLDLIVVGTENSVAMLEGSSNEVSEEIITEAIMIAQKEIAKIVDMQKSFANECGVKQTKVENVEDEFDAHVARLLPEYKDSIKKGITIIDKLEREQALSEINEKIKQNFPEDENGSIALTVYERLTNICFRELVVKDKKRPDGRAFDEVRKITCGVGILPRTHGSALFSRGETQALAVATLGTPRDKQIIDDLEGEYKKHFMLHYNFPSFAVGEARPNRGPGRREIGHGNLAERALEPMLPQSDNFPYTIRIVSDILESNGSSSMASVCGGTLSLMDAGVPIKNPVAGISVGLVKEKEGDVLLVDIAGFEDHYGDMDFKVAGTVNGITAIQLDIKIEGLDRGLIENTLALSKKSRLKILDIMKETIKEPRAEMSKLAPKIDTVMVDPGKVRLVIGQGGKNIKKIMEDCKVEIDVTDLGEVIISAVDAEGLVKAKEMVLLYTADAEVGKIYKGRVTKITTFGAFVEILPGKEGLVHVSQLADKRVEKVEDFLSEGDEIYVKLFEIDSMGRLNLSKKMADKERG
ncbi:MAG: polyribonucleotide nucleotidyltransferase [Elusimicrobiota bacterium]